MLRPSFKKYFHDDNFEDSNIESAIEAEPSLISERECDMKRRAKELKSEGKDPNWDSDRSVYELQLNQLQEQLVETMLENQQLNAELQKLKDKGLDSLLRDLEDERKKNKKLEEKLRKAKPKRPPEPCAKEKKSSERKGKDNVSSDKEGSQDGWEDLGNVAEGTIYPEGVLLASGIPSINNVAFAGTLPKNDKNLDDKMQDNLKYIEQERQSRLMKWKIKAWNFLHDRISDFVDDESAQTELEELDEPLAVKTLRENVSRFTDAIQPIRHFLSSCEQMVTWKNPWFSLSAFMIYLYSVWIGCFIPFMLLLAIVKMSINYLYAKGIAQKFGYSEKDKSIDEDSKVESTSWSEKYQLVLQIARKVQNTLGSLADALEKFESLFIWKHHEASQRLYTALVVAFFACLILPTTYFYTPLGFGIGFKLFVISPVYKKFPKVKKRYDDVARLWDELPTLEDLSNQKARTETDGELRKTSIQNPAVSCEDGPPRPGSRLSVERRERESSVDSEVALSWDTIVFCDRFQLPQSEQPLTNWQDGRRCTLLNKDSPLSNMKHGRLYLTKNFLCFERNQFHSKKNFALRLHDILEIQKSKPFAFFPGNGMSIEITTKTNEKPFLFGAMMGRDEAYESILRAGRGLNLAWGRKS